MPTPALVRIPAPVRLGLVLVCALSAPSLFAEGMETLIVDFGTALGPAGDPVATGFRGTFANIVPDSLILPIKPSAVGSEAHFTNFVTLVPESTDQVWARAAAAGAVLGITIYDGIFYDAQGDSMASFNGGEHWADGFQGGPDNSATKMEEWRAHLRRLVAYIQEHRVVAGDTVEVHYDIWNEPDLKSYWHPHSDYGEADSLFYDVWREAVTVIRDADSLALAEGLASIAGPSFAGGIIGLDSTYVDEHQVRLDSGIRLEGLLSYWDAHDCWPDILAWHHNAYSDFAAGDDETDPKGMNILGQVREAKARIAAHDGDTTAIAYEVSEMLGLEHFMIPGVLVRAFAVAERARSEGLVSVGRTYWCLEPTQPPCDGADTTDIGGWCADCESDEGVYWPLQWTRLSGLVVPYGPDLWKKRYAWWVYKAYADLEGQYVSVAASDTTFDGLAAVDASTSSARVLIGRYQAPTGADSLQLVLEHLDEVPGLVKDGIVQVEVNHYPANWDSLWRAGVTADDIHVASMSKRYPVDANNTLTLTLGGDAAFDTLDAVSVVLSAPTFASITAAQRSDGILTAMSQSDMGDTVKVDISEEAYEPFVIKRRMVVRAKSGTPAVQSNSSEVAVAFPAVADSLTLLTGFTILAGDGASAAVALQGQGVVEDCTISDNGNALSAALVTMDRGATLRDCNLNLSSGEARAIWVQDEGTGNALIEGDTVTVAVATGGSTKDCVRLQGAGSIVRGCTFSVSGTDSLGCTVINVPDAVGAGSVIEDNTLETAGKGVYVSTGQAGGVEIQRNQILNCYHGVWLASGVDQSVNRNTILRDECEAWSDGIHIGASLGTAASSFQNNLLVDLRYGIDLDGDKSTNWTFLHNAYARSDEDCGDAYPTGYYNFTIYQIMEIDYPLFCEGREGTRVYSHRIDSRGTPGNNGTGEIIGVYGVECGWGTLSRSSFVAGGDSVVVLEDLVVPSDKKLTLEEGAVLAFDGDDESEGGEDSSRNELIVAGELRLDGSDGTVALTSTSVSPSAGDWSGIVAEPGAEVHIAQGEIRYAETAIRDAGLPGATIDVESTTIRDVGTAAVYLYPVDQTTDGAGSLHIDDCVIDMTGAPKGIWVMEHLGKTAYADTIAHTSIAGNSAGSYGIYLQMRGSGGIEGQVDSVTVTGLSAGTGIYIAKYSPVLTSVTASGCKWGVQLAGSGAPWLRADPITQAGTSIVNCTTGLYSTAASAAVSDVAISGCTTGLYTASSGGGTFQDVDISGGNTGFNAQSTGVHTFREGSVTGFTDYGVKTLGASGLDLGTVSDPGDNNIYSSQSGVIKYVSVKYPISGVDIMAEENWWGEYPAPSAMFSTAVDYTPERQSLSTLGFRLGGITMGPLAASLAVRPNPSSGAFTLEYVVPGTGESMDLEVFDVTGRRVWKRHDDVASVGRHNMLWGGQDETGRVLPSGIYFVRYRVGKDERTARIVRVTH